MYPLGRFPTLEKIAGICLVEKLRAIQLYEADFNCCNYFIFGRAAMDSLTKNDYLPEELFSQKGSTAEDICLIYFVCLRCETVFLFDAKWTEILC